MAERSEAELSKYCLNPIGDLRRKIKHMAKRSEAELSNIFFWLLSEIEAKITHTANHGRPKCGSALEILFYILRFKHQINHKAERSEPRVFEFF